MKNHKNTAFFLLFLFVSTPLFLTSVLAEPLLIKLDPSVLEIRFFSPSPTVFVHGKLCDKNPGSSSLLTLAHTNTETTKTVFLDKKATEHALALVLEGPKKDVLLRKKERHFGAFVNSKAKIFHHVSSFCLVASTLDIAPETLQIFYKECALGGNYAKQKKEDQTSLQAYKEQFSENLLHILQKRGLYLYQKERLLLEDSTFRGFLHLPAYAPPGTYALHSYVFKNGIWRRQTTQTVQVVLSQPIQNLKNLAEKHSLFYGILAVLLAVVISALTTFIFRRR